jgi:hypothetical protein
VFRNLICSCATVTSVVVLSVVDQFDV